MNGALMQALRKSKNMSQDYLAKKLNVSRQTIYNWEAGLSHPGEEKLKEIAQILNISEDILISETAIASAENLVIESKMSEQAPEQNLHKKDSGCKKKIIALSCALVLVVLSSSIALLSPAIELFSTNKGVNNGETVVFINNWHAPAKDTFWLILTLSIIVITVLVCLIVHYVRKNKK